MTESFSALSMPRVWSVGSLCHAVADVLNARFNPVSVRGEVAGFSRATSGHCYFSLKDENGQIRCAMFRRSAQSLDFTPRDGELVEATGRLGVYEQRGDLQLIVESMTRAGQGVLFEQFLRLKAKLDGEGLFDPGRKRKLPRLPRGIGVVTSLGAAALHDVTTALRRRAPHIPVTIVPALVQGALAPKALIQSLTTLFQLATQQGNALVPAIDVILLVRGGGSMEDLWAFNDEQLARTLALSPVPVICGVGHETDFTIADFVADLRAPTPTAAAELAALDRDAWLGALQGSAQRLNESVLRLLDRQSQRLDASASRLGRPSGLMTRHRLGLATLAQGLQWSTAQGLRHRQQELQRIQDTLPDAARRGLLSQSERLQRASLRLGLLDPTLVLQRGYAWLSTSQGDTISRVMQTQPGQRLRATLVDGTVDMQVSSTN